MANTPNDRCRLVLACSAEQAAPSRLESALCGGDVASVILYRGQGDDQANDFTDFIEWAVPMVQGFDTAVLIADDTQMMGRSGADGLLIQKDRPQIADLAARLTPKYLVACGNIRDRHTALVVGEAKPDVVLFGKPDGDIKAVPHPKNLALAEWWAQLVEIPCMVMGGSDPVCALDVALTGADFICLSRGVFEEGENNPGLIVSQINDRLDAHAPRFEEATA